MSDKEINAKNLTEQSKHNFIFLKLLGALFSIVPQIIIFTLSLALIIISPIIIVVTIIIISIAWWYFDSLQALGLSVLAFGLLPLIALTLVIIAWKLLSLEKSIIKSIWNTLTAKEIAKEKNTEKKPKKKLNIILISFLAALTLFGTVGSFAGNNTIGGAILTGNYINSQTETIEFNDQDNVYYNLLSILAEYSVKYELELIKDKTIESSNLEITRYYNNKENLTLTFDKKPVYENHFALYIAELPTELPINIAEIPWYLLIFNKITLKYNPGNLNLSIFDENDLP